MLIIDNSEDLKKVIFDLKKDSPNKRIGFVPTMGALHHGHLSLIKKAAEQSEYVVCSIFVNPTQFNNSEDLENYPSNIDDDIQTLNKTDCDLVFLPNEKDIYPSKKKQYKIDFNGLDEQMEGKFRPGHFIGVAMVVERFFDLVTPDLAFFGQKDFQQLAIINKMAEIRGYNLRIIECPTARTKQGLALSSRNQRLSKQEQEDALIIHKTLIHARKEAYINLDTEDLKQNLIEFFEQGNLRLEYLEIVENKSLHLPQKLVKNCTCCIAAYAGTIRLIDNIKIS